NAGIYMGNHAHDGLPGVSAAGANHRFCSGEYAGMANQLRFCRRRRNYAWRCLPAHATGDQSRRRFPRQHGAIDFLYLLVTKHHRGSLCPRHRVYCDRTVTAAVLERTAGQKALVVVPCRISTEFRDWRSPVSATDRAIGISVCAVAYRVRAPTLAAFAGAVVRLRGGLGGVFPAVCLYGFAPDAHQYVHDSHLPITRSVGVGSKRSGYDTGTLLDQCVRASVARQDAAGRRELPAILALVL